MKRLFGNTQVLGGRSSQLKLDSSLRNEFGWGNHTTEACIISFGAVQSHAAVYISEELVLIVLTPNADVATHYTQKKNEDKYIINFIDIIDIEIKLEPAKLYSALHKEEKDVRRQSTRIFLRGGEECLIDTYDSDHLAKSILASWQSSMIRSSACIGTLRSNEDSDLANDYYSETVACLKGVKSQTETMEILDEFSTEVMNDLELKEVVFRSRELMLTSMRYINTLMKKQPVFKSESAAHSKRYSEVLPFHSENKSNSTILRNSENSPLNLPDIKRKDGLPGTTDNVSIISTESKGYRKPELSVEQQHQLMIIVVHRLQMIHCFLKMLCSVFFCSESIASRLSTLLGPTPLDLDSWLQFLVPDLCQEMCSNLGCPETTFQAEVDRDIQLSLEDAQTRRHGSFAVLFPEEINNGYNSDTTGATPRKGLSRTPSMAKLITTPRGEKMKPVSIAMPLDEYTAAMKQLPLIRQSIKDLQCVLCFEIFRIHALGRCMGNTVHNAVTADIIVLDHVKSAVRMKETFTVGEVFTKQANWEDTLEVLVVRISGLLDDMLGSEHISGHNNNNAGANSSHSENPFLTVALSPYCGVSGSGSHDLSVSYESRQNPLAMPPSPLPGTRNTRTGGGALLSSIIDTPSVVASNRSRSNTAEGLNYSAPPTMHSSPAASGLLNKKLFASHGGESAELSHTGSQKSLLLPGKKSKVLQDGSGGSMFFPSLDGIASRGSFSGTVASAHTHHSVANDFSKFKNSTIQTQEILLFFLTHLVLALARDSYKVRETLLRELGVYWKSIIGIFNIICPRPKPEVLRKNRIDRLLKEQSRAAMVSVSREKTAEIPRSKFKNKDEQDDENVRNMSKGNGKLHKLIKMFRGKSSGGNTVSEPINAQNNNNNNLRNRNTLQISNPYGDNGDEEDDDYYTRTSVKDNKSANNDKLYSFEYGPPKYGLSVASWALLVQSRQAVEEILTLLNIKCNLFNTAAASKLPFGTGSSQPVPPRTRDRTHSGASMRRSQHTASNERLLQQQLKRNNDAHQPPPQANAAQSGGVLSIEVPVPTYSRHNHHLHHGDGGSDDDGENSSVYRYNHYDDGDGSVGNYSPLASTRNAPNDGFEGSNVRGSGGDISGLKRPGIAESPKLNTRKSNAL